MVPVVMCLGLNGLTFVCLDSVCAMSHDSRDGVKCTGRTVLEFACSEKRANRECPDTRVFVLRVLKT